MCQALVPSKIWPPWRTTAAARPSRYMRGWNSPLLHARGKHGRQRARGRAAGAGAQGAAQAHCRANAIANAGPPSARLCRAGSTQPRARAEQGGCAPGEAQGLADAAHLWAAAQVDQLHASHAHPAADGSQGLTLAPARPPQRSAVRARPRHSGIQCLASHGPAPVAGLQLLLELRGGGVDGIEVAVLTLELALDALLARVQGDRGTVLKRGREREGESVALLGAGRRLGRQAGEGGRPAALRPPPPHLLHHALDPVCRLAERVGHQLGLLQAVHLLALVVVVCGAGRRAQRGARESQPAGDSGWRGHSAHSGGAPSSQVMMWAVVRPVWPAPTARASSTTTFLPAWAPGGAGMGLLRANPSLDPRGPQRTNSRGAPPRARL